MNFNKIVTDEVCLKRIGLFGGTFDPIHFGHLRAALEVREAFALDETCLIPSAIPPHKIKSCVTKIDQRLAMIQLALGNSPLFTVSDIELKRLGPSYSIDTVDYFKSLYPDGSRLFLIMGVDAFLEIHTWKAYNELFQGISIVVMTRPAGIKEINADSVKTIGAYLKDRISTGYHYSDKNSAYIHTSLPDVHVFKVSPLDISSSMIRNLVKQGKSIRFFLPDKVVNYINNQGLYR
ncbi:MAG: nicotinate (nicotinamide) nucleotide adenylyltransferase [Desulfobacteraceae bacterium 4572_123]|nr:MAG: nicotinate (nicotinamide) nucleotide adenylyltransferase [Desulfobacteraceae bacterium 4572_123]